MNKFIKLCIGSCLLVISMSHCHKKTACVVKSENTISPPPLPRFITKLTAKDTLLLNQDTLIYFKRGSCFGTCASYEYTIYKNGVVHYIGFNNTSPLGSSFALLSLAQWTTLINKANQINIYQLADYYPEDMKNYIPDLPNTYIMVKEVGKRKYIRDNHSCPKNLKDFEIMVDGLLQGLNYGLN